VCWVLCLGLLTALPCPAQTNFSLRVMAANLPGNAQKYEAPQIRILQGLQPDVVAIQEFNHLNNTPSDIRAFVDTALGTNFAYYREPGYAIPNGIISRWPITNSGSWSDAVVPDRGFAWAQIDLPGTNDLYVVSVHLYSSGSASDRNQEATAIKSKIQSSFPTNAWVIVAGDMNTDSRSESAITTFRTFLSDTPVPSDALSGGDEDTNLNRNKPYDYVLPSFSLTNCLTNVVIGAQSFPKGLVFDSRVFTPLSSVAPVLLGDSGNCQHMAVVKDFQLSPGGTNPPVSTPEITDQPDSLTVPEGGDAIFSVSATGTAPLNYQWRFNEGSLPDATNASYSRIGVQPADAGGYDVVITNSEGSVTSSVAVLTILPPGTNAFTAVLAGWDVSEQSGFGTSPLPPTTNAANLTVVGLTRGAGVTTAQTAAARAWGGNGFDAASAIAAAANDDVALFAVAASAGFEVSFASISRLDYRRSSTGPANGVLQYRLGNGSFTDISNLSYASTSSSGASLPSIDLSSIAALQNIGAGTNVTFRLVNHGATSASGTWYVFDVANSSAPDLALSGSLTPVEAPATLPATLVNPGYAAGQFQFQLNGQTGAAYVIESTTNLSGDGWVPAVTNTAPFLYWESNASVAPAHLYRGRPHP